MIPGRALSTKSKLDWEVVGAGRMPSKAGICIIEQAVAESVLCGEAPYDVAHAIRTWPGRPGYEEESIYKHVHPNTRFQI